MSGPTVGAAADWARATEQVKRQALALGFDKVGIASAADPPDLTSLRAWLAAGMAADMAWMADPRRMDPERVLPGVQSLVCVALNYYTPTCHSRDPAKGKISRYAWGRDYHRVLGRRLKQLHLWMQAQFPDYRGRFYVDTGPVAEKPWAMQAGLGWIGKNGLLLTREYGSWVFLGVILTTLPLIPDRPHTAHCGTCSRCLEACPTQAIVSPGVVDSRRCIAYHTLESHAEQIPAEIAQNLHNWVAGCDICQEVCPWNQRFARPSRIPDFQPYPWNVAPDLQELARIGDEEFDRRFPASALRRLKAHRLRRNAKAALSGHSGSTAHSNDLEAHTPVPHPEALRAADANG
ncbi:MULTISPECIES: tRNA epoxyqueuosine(34) reductase QueG [unclassified Synechococcus]|uniref:tRNA epoxyqueuosine(34) reductase QueG n=1 Tax=unclassified Synechococcus TaxID=2626047 RepID=UPI000C47E20E|nr:MULTISPECIES: tRNA epoxyqueuosine(34) reductase QueG [unclassified Synechococcus]PIK88184.1 Epoxyqueuosine reductase [Synechococcus sp. 65AY6A5]